MALRSLAAKSLFPTQSVRSVLSTENKDVTLRGWIRSVRKQKSVSFAIVNDGTTLKGIQAVLTEQDAEK